MAAALAIITVAAWARAKVPDSVPVAEAAPAVEYSTLAAESRLPRRFTIPIRTIQRKPGRQNIRGRVFCT